MTKALTEAILTHCENNKFPLSTIDACEWAAGYSEALATVENLLLALPITITGLSAEDVCHVVEPLPEDDEWAGYLEGQDSGTETMPPDDGRIGATGDNNRPFGYRPESELDPEWERNQERS